MNQPLKTLENAPQPSFSPEAYAVRVANFRHRAKHAPGFFKDPLAVFFKELAQSFSAQEIEILLTVFSDWTPVEIVEGKPMSAIIRIGMAHPPGTTLNPNVYDYYMGFGALARKNRMFASAANPPDEQQLKNPTPSHYTKKGRPVYITESPGQRILRQLDDGKYLYGDIGGLVGGLVFYSSKQMGHTHDAATAHGKFASDIVGLLSNIKDVRDGMKNRTEAPKGYAGAGKPGIQHVGQAPQRGDPIRFIPALPLPKDMGPDANRAMINLMKTIRGKDK
ncbi:hypothetical protein [Sagittula stellata]|uniref:Uncharacterized protein n=1 Tax=Sagittula stellata (strain ATCC 700073 / DSM 11524 / E-37) TaxID=388399 RepID=A3K2I1_SAGS3|nr:hypothetical protein [Sagittula stellata]EBA08390.1 hypothetical protein SSE37_16298 [Sagittula stellata E-37]